MAQAQVPKPVEKIQAAAEGAAQAQTAPPGVRRARTLLIKSSLGVLAVAFTVLTIVVKLRDSLPIDLRVTRFLQTSDAPLFKAIMVAVSWPGYVPQAFGVVAVLGVVLYLFGLRWEALMSAVAAIGVVLINLALKTAIHRDRPTPNLVDVFSDVGGYSFPSGHVMFYVAYFGFLWFLVYTLFKDTPKRTATLVGLGVLVVLVGPSRVYLGAHWASDVIGAYLLGILVLFAIVHAYHWGKTRFFVRQPVAPPVQ
jgi:membrane-associated phospholipid phosphatase